MTLTPAQEKVKHIPQVIEYAIIGHYRRWGRRPESFVRFAGGRSRRKLQLLAQRMNENGHARCRVILMKRLAQ